MKQSISLLFILISIPFTFAQESIDLNDYVKTHDLQMENSRQNDIYPESTIQFFTDRGNNKFLLCSEFKNYFAIGDLGSTDLLIDMNGNGIADKYYESVNIPYWIIKKKSEINSDNYNILNDLTIMYYAFEANESIKENDSYLGAMKNLGDSLKDINFENRDLYYLIYLHSVSHNRDSEWSFYALKELDLNLQERYSLEYTHPTIYIYILEFLIKKENWDESLSMNNFLMKEYPDNSIFKLYDYMIRKLDYSTIPAELKEHWLYKEKFVIKD